LKPYGTILIISGLKGCQTFNTVLTYDSFAIADKDLDL